MKINLKGAVRLSICILLNDLFRYIRRAIKTEQYNDRPITIKSGVMYIRLHLLAAFRCGIPPHRQRRIKENKLFIQKPI